MEYVAPRSDPLLQHVVRVLKAAHILPNMVQPLVQHAVERDITTKALSAGPLFSLLQWGLQHETGF